MDVWKFPHPNEIEMRADNITIQILPKNFIVLILYSGRNVHTSDILERSTVVNFDENCFVFLNKVTFK